MSENIPKAPQFADDDWRSKVELPPGKDGYPRWDESGEGIWVKPNPETQCGNCGNKLESDDKYCRYCGTKRGDGAYEPYMVMLDMNFPVGGNPPPVAREHNCPNCGYSWIIYRVTDDQKYCPMCGNPASVCDCAFNIL